MSDASKPDAPDPRPSSTRWRRCSASTSTPEFRPGVVANLETTIARMAALVLAAPLDEREEPAAVFRP